MVTAGDASQNGASVNYATHSRRSTLHSPHTTTTGHNHHHHHNHHNNNHQHRNSYQHHSSTGSQTNSHSRSHSHSHNFNELQPHIESASAEPAPAAAPAPPLAPQTPFKLFTRDSLRNSRQTQNKQRAASKSSLPKQQPVEPDPSLAAGAQLPRTILRLMPDSLFGKPIEDIDPYYAGRETFVIISRGKEISRFSAASAICLFGPLHPIRRVVLYILVNPLFNLMVMLTILTNCILMTMQGNEAVERTEIIFTIVYTTEMGLKILARGFVMKQFTYLRDPWNWLDFAVIIMAYMTIVVEDLGNLSVIRTFRVLRALKTVAIIPGMKTIVGAVIDSVKNLKDVVVLTLFSLSVFSLLGLQIYMGVLTQKCIQDGAGNMTDIEWREWCSNRTHWLPDEDAEMIDSFRLCGNASGAQTCPNGHTCLQGFGPNPDYGYTNFDTFGWALICSFRLMTQDFWEGLYMQILKTAGSWHIIFFLFSIFLGSIYLMNLILAIVAMSYNELQRRAEQEDIEAAEDEAEFLESCRIMEEVERRMSDRSACTSQCSGFGFGAGRRRYRPSLEIGALGAALAEMCQNGLLPGGGGGRSMSLSVGGAGYGPGAGVGSGYRGAGGLSAAACHAATPSAPQSMLELRRRSSARSANSTNLARLRSPHPQVSWHATQASPRRQPQEQLGGSYAKILVVSCPQQQQTEAGCGGTSHPRPQTATAMRSPTHSVASLGATGGGELPAAATVAVPMHYLSVENFCGSTQAAAARRASARLMTPASATSQDSTSRLASPMMQFPPTQQQHQQQQNLGSRRMSRDEFTRRASNWSRLSMTGNLDMGRLIKIWARTNPYDSRRSFCSVASRAGAGFETVSPTGSSLFSADRPTNMAAAFDRLGDAASRRSSSNSTAASYFAAERQYRAKSRASSAAAINAASRRSYGGHALSIDDAISASVLGSDCALRVVHNASWRDKSLAYCLSCLDVLCIWQCCGAWLHVQRVVSLIVFDPFTELFIILCILINTLFMALDTEDTEAELKRVFERGNYFFTATFAVEAAMKIAALSPKFYFREGWNVFDAIVVALSMLELSLEGYYGLSVLRSFRLLRVFKLARTWPMLNNLLTITGKAIGDLGNLTFVLAIIVFIFAVMGMQLFGTKYQAAAFPNKELPRWNFTDFMHSFMIVFRILCAEWIEPMWDCMLVSGWPCVPFFLIAVTVGNLVVLNLFLALLLASFGASNLSSPKTDSVDTKKLQDAIGRFSRFGRWTRAQVVATGRLIAQLLASLTNKVSRKKETSCSNSKQQSSTAGDATTCEEHRPRHNDDSQNLTSKDKLDDGGAQQQATEGMPKFLARTKSIEERTEELKCRIRRQAPPGLGSVAAGRHRNYHNLRQLAKKSQLKRQQSSSGDFDVVVPATAGAGIPIIVSRSNSQDGDDSGDSGVDNYGSFGGYRMAPGFARYSPQSPAASSMQPIREDSGDTESESPCGSLLASSHCEYTVDETLYIGRDAVPRNHDGVDSDKLDAPRETSCGVLKAVDEADDAEADADELTSPPPADSTVVEFQTDIQGTENKAHPQMQTPNSSIIEPTALHHQGLSAPSAVELNAQDEKDLQWIENNIERCICIGILCLRWFLLRQFVRKIVEHKYFDRCILLLIIISSGTLALEDKHLNERPTLMRTLDVLDTIFTIIFSLEMIFKWTAFGFRRYFGNIWSWLDFFIVLVSVINLMASIFGRGKIQELKTLRTLRAMRGLRPLRALQRFQGMRVVVNALIQAIPGIFNVLLVILVFWLIFSIMGVQMFGGKFWRCISPTTREVVDYMIAENKQECLERNLTWANTQINFDNVLNGYLALFQVATFKGWIDIMNSAVDSRMRDDQPIREVNIYMYFYFIFFIIFGSFFTLNLFIGVIIDNFNEQKKKTGGSLEIFMTDEQKKYYHAIKKMKSKRPVKAITRPKFKLQAYFFDITTSKKFDMAIMVIIGLNMFVMSLEHYNEPPQFSATLESLNLLFIAVFTLECLCKIFALRHFYFREAWNTFDFVVVVLSILGVVMKEYVAKYFVSPTLFRVARVVKVGRVLRLVKGAKGIRTLLFALAMSLPALFNICLLLFLVMFIYAIFGMSFFMNVRQRNGIDETFNFDTFFSSIIVLFEMSTSAGWDIILDPLMDEENDCQKPDPALGIEGNCGNKSIAIFYLVSYVIITYLIIINMYIAVILENYSQATEDVQEGLTDDDYEMYYEIWQKFDPNGKQFLPLEQLSDFVDALEDPLRISKPNELVLVLLDITIYEGTQCYCVDILDALTKHFFARKGLQIEVNDQLKQVQTTLHETPFERISTTLLLKRQHYCAKVIQNSWRRWRQLQNTAKQKQLEAAQNALDENSTQSRTSLSKGRRKSSSSGSGSSIGNKSKCSESFAANQYHSNGETVAPDAYFQERKQI